MRLVSVTYTLDDEEEKRLKNLLPYYRNYVTAYGDRPFADWGPEDLFDALMCQGSKWDIKEKLDREERLAGGREKKSEKAETPGEAAPRESRW